MTRAKNLAKNHSIPHADLLCAVCVFAAALAITNVVTAQSMVMIYPSQGQSMEQQSRDEVDCRAWAQQQTGFDPSRGPAYVGGSTAQGQMVGGAARGAALGAVGGAIGGDAGRGAAIGAGVGATAGLMRRGRQRQAQQQRQQQEIDRHNQQMANYNRGFATCMQGRGYTVN